ncbi:MAG: 5-aminoimidazole-4-carboxamide ribonucleotide transformylase [Bacteroidetes bacterium]|nr:5-aminoimidazole-4-carboxamide ribonucleotide transformylase [Bacteroidota bacterium]
MILKYGMNPYQDYAEIVDNSNALTLLNGNPSVINILDALNSWQLVKKVSQTLNTECSASFKHVTPSGVAISKELADNEKQAYLIRKSLSKIATAYARARGTDRLASFGDFISLSDCVDKETALLIKSEVSDGIIAPEFSNEALEILCAKKKGNYVIFQIDKDFEPKETESREIYGITIKQKRNNLKVSDKNFSNIATQNKTIPANILSDLKLGMLTLKYTQSNSICVVSNGHVIGIGSGQQSRILCSNLALTKANIWYQKSKLNYSFLNQFVNKKRTELDQLIELERQKQYGDKILLNELPNTCMLSDGFFPQIDNIELAHQFGIKYIATPMGSIRDNEIIETANKYGIIIINTGIRLFHH